MPDRTVRMYNPTHRFDGPRGHGPTADPTVRWRKQYDGSVRQVATFDGTLYVAVGASVVALSRAGDLQWRFQANEPVWTSPAVVDDTVYFCDGDAGSFVEIPPDYHGSVYALDASDGTVQWTYQVASPYDMKSSPAVVDGTVYVGSAGGNVYALDATDGTERWRFQTGGRVDSSPAVMDGTVYAGSDDGRIYALDTGGGSLLTSHEQWHFQTGDAVNSSPTVVDGTVYVGCHDNRIYALDATDGTEQWRFQTDGQVRTSPTVGDGTVYLGSCGLGSTLYALTGTDTKVFEADRSGSTKVFEPDQT